MKKLTKWLAGVLLGVFLLSACGNTDSPSNTTAPTSQTEDTAPETSATSTLESDLQTIEETSSLPETSPTAYPLTIADSMGKEIIVQQEPQKVISLGPNITEIIFALDAQEKLIGRTTYCDYPESTASIDTVGTLMSPDIEKIVSLKPDILIASTHFSEDSEKQLEDLGIQVVVLFEEHDMDGVYKMIQTLGSIMNKNTQATEIVSNMQARITAVEEYVRDKEVPTVYYVVGFGEYGDFTAGGDTFVHQLITLAGGDNIAKDVSGWNFTLEKLIELNPEIIIVGTGMKDSFIADENYKELNAVKNDKVYEIDNNLLDRQGVRNADGIEALATILHAAE